MPVSCRCFEPEVVLGSKVVVNLSEETYRKERCADDYVEAVESGGHEESGAVDSVSDREGGLVVLHSLEDCEIAAEQNS